MIIDNKENQAMKKEKQTAPKSSEADNKAEMNTNKSALETARKRDVLKDTKDSNLDDFGTDQNSDPVLTKNQ
jgi:hypothetical protein